MAETIVEGTARRGRCSAWVDASVGNLGGSQRRRWREPAAAVERRGDDASVDGISKSWRQREPATVVERCGVATVSRAGRRPNHRMREDPLGLAPRRVTAAEGTGRGVGAPRGGGGGAAWGGCRIVGCRRIRLGCLGLQLLGDCFLYGTYWMINS
jgi:hypothetical protein